MFLLPAISQAAWVQKFPPPAFLAAGPSGRRIKKSGLNSPRQGIGPIHCLDDKVFQPVDRIGLPCSVLDRSNPKTRAPKGPRLQLSRITDRTIILKEKLRSCQGLIGQDWPKLRVITAAWRQVRRPRRAGIK